MRSSAVPAILLALALGTGTAAGSGEEGAAGGIRIGLLLPSSDPALARSLERGAALAAARASTGTSPVRVVPRAAAGPWGSEAAEAARLACDDVAIGIVAPPGREAAHLAVQVATKARVPVVILSGAGALTRLGLLRVARAVPGEGRVVADLLAAVPAVPADPLLAIFAEEGREGERTAAAAAAVARERGWRVLPPVAVGRDGAGAGPAAALRERADAALLALPAGPGARVLRDLRAAGWRGTALAGPGTEGAALAAAAGEGAEGMILHRLFDPDRPGEPGRFRDAWRERYGGEPDAAGAAAHDAVLLLVRAAREAGGTAEGAGEALLGGGPLEGATGRIVLDGAGNRAGGASLARVVDGRPVATAGPTEVRR